MKLSDRLRLRETTEPESGGASRNGAAGYFVVWVSRRKSSVQLSTTSS